MTPPTPSERAAIQNYVDRRNAIADRARITQAQSGVNIRMETPYNPFEPQSFAPRKRAKRQWRAW